MGLAGRVSFSSAMRVREHTSRDDSWKGLRFLHGSFDLPNPAYLLDTVGVRTKDFYD